MTEVRTLTLLRLTLTETFEYDRERVLGFARLHNIGHDWYTDDDRITATFEKTAQSVLGDELFGSLADMDSGMELFTRREDE